MRFSRLMCMAALLAPIAARADEAIHWRASLEDAKKEAAETNRLVLIHFWAPWCGPCMRLESTVFSRPNVGAAMESRYVPFKVNAQDFKDTCRQFGVERLPTDVIMTPSGRILQRLQCPQDPLLYTTQLIQTANAIAGSGPRPTSPQVASAPTVPATPPDNGPFRSAAVVMPSQSPPPAQVAMMQQGPPPAMMQQPMMQQAPRAQIIEQPPAGAAAANLSTGPGGMQYSAPASVGVVYPAGAGVSPATAMSPAPMGRGPDGYAAVATSDMAPPMTPSPAAVASASDYRPTIVNGLPDNPVRPRAPVAVASTNPNVAASPATPNTAAPAISAPVLAATASPAASAGPRFGLDGYCPVTLVERSKVSKNNPWVWVRGDARWGAVHRGVTYLFIGPEEQKKFLAAPDSFAPVLSGNDVVVAFDQGKLEPGRREFGMFCNGRIYLFSSQESLNKFLDRQNTDRYMDLAWRAENSAH